MRKLISLNNLLIFILLVLIIFRAFITKERFINGQKVRVTETIFQEPINYEKTQSVKVSSLTAYLPKYPEINYGDRIVVEGVVDNKKLINAKLISIEKNKGYLSSFRNKIISFYVKTIPQPLAGLTAGIVLGSKAEIPNTFWEQTKLVGVTHVIVASGTNITYVSAFLISFLTVFLPRKKAIPFVILGIVLYIFISGFEAPIIRAAVMSTLVFASQLEGRITSSWRILLLTALGMLLINPKWISDIGFILSFVSTASLMLFEKRVRDKLNFVPEFLKEGLSTSIAAQIGVSPILFVTFGYFNILSPIVNALILWTIPYIMIFGVLGGVVGLVSPFLGRLFLYLGYPFLTWFSLITTFFCNSKVISV